MNFELVEKLKDEGFSLPKHDWPKGTSFCNRGCYWDNSFCQPSLSELIEACGDEFRNLERGKISGNWGAFTFPGNGHKRAEGSTPEEAVAKLWLAINEEHATPKLEDPNYSSGHSIDVNGNCNLGCC